MVKTKLVYIFQTFAMNKPNLYEQSFIMYSYVDFVLKNFSNYVNFCNNQLGFRARNPDT